jgi:hypothetical protein
MLHLNSVFHKIQGICLSGFQCGVLLCIVIQGVSGGKVNILVGDSIGQCERKNSYEHVSDAK